MPSCRPMRASALFLRPRLSWVPATPSFPTSWSCSQSSFPLGFPIGASSEAASCVALTSSTTSWCHVCSCPAEIRPCAEAAAKGCLALLDLPILPWKAGLAMVGQFAKVQVPPLARPERQALLSLWLELLQVMRGAGPIVFAYVRLTDAAALTLIYC